MTTSRSSTARNVLRQLLWVSLSILLLSPAVGADQDANTTNDASDGEPRTSAGDAATTDDVWPPPVQLSSDPSCVTSAITAREGGTTYDVGPGQTHPSLNTVPWLSLKAGDVVNIYYQPTPYATITVMRAVGTKAAPITINGVTDSHCNRPVITGQNAVLADDALASGYWTASTGSAFLGYGLMNFCFARFGADGIAVAPAYINVQNLEITGAATGNNFTGPDGAPKPWKGSSGIYAVLFSHVNIQNNYVHGNDGGIFFNSQDVARTSSYVTIRGNIFAQNGMPGSDRVHNVYGQGYRTLYEGNWFGQEIPSAGGSTLKDRSSGTVIRYNYIVASERAIDLVDSETSPTVMSDPLYPYAWVYGNIIVDNFRLPHASLRPIHWGGDSGHTENYHHGTLYAYFNTFVIENTSEYTDVGIFDMPTIDQTVQASSNIFYGIYGGSKTPPPFYPLSLTVQFGTLNMSDTNYISYLNDSAFRAAPYGISAYKNYPAQPPGTPPATVTFKNSGTILTGSTPALNANFTVMAGSPVIGKGMAAPTIVPVQGSGLNLANLRPVAQYGNRLSNDTSPNGNPSIAGRITALDLGALSAK